MKFLRSLLFTPGDSGRKLQKAAQSNADGVVIDLEDAIAPSALPSAQQQTVQALQSIDFGDTQRLVRINAHSLQAALADIDAIIPGKPDGIVVPKVESPEILQQLADKLPEETALFALIETAAGFLNLPQIVNGPDKLEGLIVGGEDLRASLGAKSTPSQHELLYARGALVMAAAARQLQAIDTVYTAWRDAEGLAAEAKRVSELGFTGKLAIHPVQLQPIHEAFSPNAEEIEWATDVAQESERLKEQGIGVFSYGGHMIDEAHVKLAQRILAMGKKD